MRKNHKSNVIPTEIFVIYGEQRKGFCEEALKKIETKT